MAEREMTKECGCGCGRWETELENIRYLAAKDGRTMERSLYDT